MAPCQTLGSYGIVLQVYCDVSGRDKPGIWISNPLTRLLLWQTHFFHLCFRWAMKFWFVTFIYCFSAFLPRSRLAAFHVEQKIPFVHFTWIITVCWNVSPFNDKTQDTGFVEIIRANDNDSSHAYLLLLELRRALTDRLKKNSRSANTSRLT